MSGTQMRSFKNAVETYKLYRKSVIDACGGSLDSYWKNDIRSMRKRLISPFNNR